MKKNKVYIYGAGHIGEVALSYLKNQYEIIGFVDSDQLKIGTTFCGLKVFSPDILELESEEIVVIASRSFKEIMRSLKVHGIRRRIILFRAYLENVIPDTIISKLEERTIDLGKFLASEKEIQCKEMTYMTGGSRILDYAFLKVVAKKMKCNTYLEIGTYIGESINILTDICERLISVTAEPGSEYSMNGWCKELDVPDYSDRLARDPKIEHYYTDSKLFDFSTVGNDIDLYFIDGDHSYAGVRTDTENVFKNRKRDSIIIWHDFKESSTEFNYDVITGVYDALNEADFEKVYITNNNICGIYIPDKYRSLFDICPLKYGEKELYIYDTSLVCMRDME